jgi:flagellar hook-basal body complex protein FliE
VDFSSSLTPLTSYAASPAVGATPSAADLLRADETTAAADSAGNSPATPGAGGVAPAFGEILSGFLQQVDESQQRADSMVESLALGEPVDVHQVMLSLNEASNALHLTMQVRSKILDAYQELMRLPL